MMRVFTTFSQLIYYVPFSYLLIMEKLINQSKVSTPTFVPWPTEIRPLDPSIYTRHTTRPARLFLLIFITLNFNFFNFKRWLILSCIVFKTKIYWSVSYWLRAKGRLPDYQALHRRETLSLHHFFDNMMVRRAFRFFSNMRDLMCCVMSFHIMKKEIYRHLLIIFNVNYIRAHVLEFLRI